MKNKCTWCLNQFDAYEKYHDEEWGVPVYNDLTHFEFLVLEGAQAGLSWATILKRREGYRNAFSNFNVKKVSVLDEESILKILQNPGVIRNKLKIRGTVINAKLFMEIQKEFGSFNTYVWQFVKNTPIVNQWKSTSEIPTTSSESDALSKDLKKRGFKFCGSTIMYAYMQACGLINDHTIDCFRHKEV